MPSPFPPGTKLGRYEIRSQLGAGGMGEVYLAVDSYLNRKVALKVLPEEFAAKPQAMERFIQEAKAASGLNHPNILTIYEIGNDGGTYFLATEYIDGETLRKHISRAQLSISRALEIGLQVASALTTAHAAGIVHRDIKPENIMIRSDGIVKVLDFGLAKLTDRSSASDADPDGATKAIVQTQSGVIVGTTAYMSPEQTRALEVDTRTDIWSLGVVLYELVAGITPFKGDTASDTSAAILKTEPTPLSEIFPETPFELERIIAKALEKNCDERYQVIKDLELDLRALKRQFELGTASEPSGTIPSRASWTLQSALSSRSTKAVSKAAHTIETIKTARGLWTFSIGALLILGMGGLFVWRQFRSRHFQPTNLVVTQLISRKNDLGETAAQHARFSPDGKLIVYASSRSGVSEIWLKQVSGGEPFTNRSADGTGPTPVWSPDGQQLAYLSQREGESGIWTMAAFGGAPSLVKRLEIPSRGLIGWSRSDLVYFRSQGNLYSVSPSTQELNQVTSFDPTKPVERSFSVSPDERQVAYTDWKDGQSDIWILRRSVSSSIRVTNDKQEDSLPVWTPDGKRLLYSSKRNGIKQIFMSYLDGSEPVQLTTNDGNTDVLDVSSDGTRILYTTGREESDLWSLSLDDGSETQITAETGIELWADISPDEKSVTFQTLPPHTGSNLFNSVVQVKSLGSSANQSQLAPDGFAPRWSPDGKQIAFMRQMSGTPNLWIVGSSGGDARQITTGGIVFAGYTYLPYNRSQTQDFEWTSDGGSLIYCAREGAVANVFQITTNGAVKKPLSANSNERFYFFNPTASSDGKVVGWLSLSPLQPGRKGTTWGIWQARDGKSEQVLESDSVLGIVGWSETDDELIIKIIRGASSAASLSASVSLLALNTKTGQQRTVADLKETYFQNIQLAPRRNFIAFVTRETGTDSLRIVSTKGGPLKTILATNDPRVFLSALSWTPGGKMIVYGKQSSWTTLSMLDNFPPN